MIKQHAWKLVAAAAWIGSTMIPSFAHANDRHSYTTSTGAPVRDGRFTGKRGAQQRAAGPDTATGTLPGEHRSLAGNAADYSTRGRPVDRTDLPPNARGGGPVEHVSPAPVRVNK